MQSSATTSQARAPADGVAEDDAGSADDAEPGVETGGFKTRVGERVYTTRRCLESGASQFPEEAIKGTGLTRPGARG